MVRLRSAVHRLRVEPLDFQFFYSRQIFRLGLIKNIVELAFADRVQNQPMLLAEQLLFLNIFEWTFGRFRSVGGGFLADAAAADEDLRLQEQIALARLALHVVDRVHMLHIGIEAENHKGSGKQWKLCYCKKSRTTNFHDATAN